ncbi:MAG: response regulator [Acidimicrobiia bacterium]|nr:response regulator [Acidimicrobiia bacterium]
MPRAGSGNIHVSLTVVVLCVESRKLVVTSGETAFGDLLSTGGHLAADVVMELELGILGPLEVRSNGELVALGGDRPRAIVALLAVSANRVVPTERIVDTLWGEDADDKAIAGLRVYISRIRKALADAGERLQTEPIGYRLAIEPDELDATRFQRLLVEGQELLDGGAPDAAARTFEQALALWRGPALAELAHHPSIAPDVVRLEESRLAAVESKMAAELAAGRHAAVVAELEGLTRAHPLRERLWAQRITALYRCGRQAEALRAYQDLRELMVEELGIEPSPELRQLEAAVLAQDSALDPRPRDSSPTEAPAANTSSVRLMLVDDHPMWREAMRASLERKGTAVVVAEADDGEAAVDAALAARPDVVLMDLHLPKLTGTEATSRIVEAVPGVRVLMLSSSGDEPDVVEAVRAGAHGYLLKTSTAAEVADAVRRAAAGEAVFTPSLASFVLGQLRAGAKEPEVELTARQRQALAALSHGKSNAEIASDLGLAEEQVADLIRQTLAALQRDEQVTVPPERAVCTVMFVDVVESTRRAAEIGDRGWRDVVLRYHELVAGTADAHGGRSVKTSGDGVLLTFGQPTAAIRAATAIRDAVATLDLDVRIGLHMGECEILPDDVHGMAVNIGARVAASAGPSEVLASQTVRDLVLGSGAQFEDRGTHELRGVPGTWHLFAVSSPP